MWGGIFPLKMLKPSWCWELIFLKTLSRRSAKAWSKSRSRLVKRISHWNLYNFSLQRLRNHEREVLLLASRSSNCVSGRPWWWESEKNERYEKIPLTPESSAYLLPHQNATAFPYRTNPTRWRQLRLNKLSRGLPLSYIYSINVSLVLIRVAKEMVQLWGWWIMDHRFHGVIRRPPTEMRLLMNRIWAICCTDFPVPLPYFSPCTPF